MLNKTLWFLKNIGNFLVTQIYLLNLVYKGQIIVNHLLIGACQRLKI